MAKYKAVEYLFSIDNDMLAKILSCAISELHRLDDITPLESQALKHALSAQFKLEMLKDEI